MIDGSIPGCHPCLVILLRPAHHKFYEDGQFGVTNLLTTDTDRSNETGR
jgi:hypothetical protein